MKAYQIIGGQYECTNYGESDSIRGAKVIAGKHKEYWDNHQGWHTPKIYKSEDCREITADDMITVADGTKLIVPKEGAEPIA